MNGFVKFIKDANQYLMLLIYFMDPHCQVVVPFNKFSTHQISIPCFCTSHIGDGDAAYRYSLLRTWSCSLKPKHTF